MKQIKRKKNESGSQLLEFALVVPVLILLAAIIIEFAGAVRNHQVLNNAAREGARLSSLPENQCSTPSCSTNTAVQNVVLNYLCVNGLKNQNCSGPTLTVAVNQNVLVPGSGGVNMSTSLVTVSSSYALPLSSAFSRNASSITLQGRAEFRNFY